MKKTILVAALATASVCYAQSNVEVYGKFRLYQESEKLGTSAGVTKQTNDLSRIGVRGSENLGGGNRAFFTLETGVGSDNPTGANTQLGDRTSIVGLKNNFGSIGAGRDVHSYAWATALYSPMAVDYGNSFGIRAHRSLRLSNALFTSFTPVKNVTVKFDHGFSEASNVEAVQSGSVEANLGFASVIAGHWTNNVGAKSSTLGAKFSLPTKTQVMLSSTQDTNPGVADVKAWTVAARQPLASNVNLEVGYGQNQQATLYTAKATYALSKRTNLLLAGSKIDHDVAAQSRQNIGVGVEHNF